MEWLWVMQGVCNALKLLSSSSFQSTCCHIERPGSAFKGKYCGSVFLIDNMFLIYFKISETRHTVSLHSPSANPPWSCYDSWATGKAPIVSHFSKNLYTVTLVNDTAPMHGKLLLIVRQLFPLCPAERNSPSAGEGPGPLSSVLQELVTGWATPTPKWGGGNRNETLPTREYSVPLQTSPSSFNIRSV